MKKREDWPEQMNAAIDERRQAKFIWGKSDCCLFAADIIAAMTNEDFAADFRGSYDSPASAYALLHRFAGGGIAATMETLSARFDWLDVEPLRAQRGDIVLAPASICGDNRFDGALGICIGTLSIFMTLDRGLRAISTIPSPGTDGITRAWRVRHGRD